MTLAPALVADALVNLFAAAGALVVAHEAVRADPTGPVTRRVGFALRFVGVLFVLRAVAWLTASELAYRMVDVLSAATPLVALVMAEGLLRRHAPRWMKLALLAGAALVFLGAIVPFAPGEVRGATLLAVVVLGFAAVGYLLWSRDKRDLSAGENGAIRRLLGALIVLLPLVSTDFRSLWPHIPVRLGAVGALLLLYLGLASANARALLASRLASLIVFLAVAIALAIGYLAVSPQPDGDQLARAAAVTFAALLFTALFSEAMGARAERSRGAEPLMLASTPEEFERRLASHPHLAGTRIVSSEALDSVRDPAFEALLAERKLLRRADHPWGRTGADDGVERADSLLAAHDASHILLLSREPLTIALVSLPGIARDARSEGEIELAQRIGEMVFATARSAS